MFPLATCCRSRPERFRGPPGEIAKPPTGTHKRACLFELTLYFLVHSTGMLATFFYFSRDFQVIYGGTSERPSVPARALWQESHDLHRASKQCSVPLPIDYQTDAKRCSAVNHTPPAATVKLADSFNNPQLTFISQVAVALAVVVGTISFFDAKSKIEHHRSLLTPLGLAILA